MPISLIFLNPAIGKAGSGNRGIRGSLNRRRLYRAKSNFESWIGFNRMVR